MRTKIQKWGDSLAICIPKELAEEAGLEIGQSVEMRLVNGELRIKRARKRKRYDLDELLASVPDDFDEGEWDIGPAVGNEIWW